MVIAFMGWQSKCMGRRYCYAKYPVCHHSFRKRQCAQTWPSGALPASQHLDESKKASSAGQPKACRPHLWVCAGEAPGSAGPGVQASAGAGQVQH